MTSGGQNFIDLTGRVFGSLAVVARAANDARDKARWHCVCSCGGEKDIAGGHLRRGMITDCGHVKTERMRKQATKHGNFSRPGYQAWLDMIKRCTNPNDITYRNYGARGISVCEEWLTFERFIADMGEPPPKMEIDRRDNDGNYTKENCRWVTHKVNCRNKRNTLLFEHNGEQKPLPEWAEEYGINKSSLYSRVRLLGWPLSRALATLVQQKRAKQSQEMRCNTETT